MRYTYNDKKLREMMEDKNLSYSKICNMLNTKADKTVKQQIKGGDMFLSRLLEYANTFDLNLLDFFFDNDVLISDTMHNLRKNDVGGELKILKKEIEHKEAVSELEKRHIKEIAEKDTESLQKIMDAEKKIRNEIRQEFGEERSLLEDKFNSALKEKDNIIKDLQNQIAELAVRYRGPEEKSGKSGYPSYENTSFGVAEGQTKNKTL